MRTSIVLLAALLAACTQDASAPKPTVASSPSATPASTPPPANRMAASQAAANERRPADAARLAEQVIQSGDFTADDAAQAETFALMAKDLAAVARIREAAVMADKMEWSKASSLPFVYRLAGDEANATRATQRLKETWPTRPERTRRPRAEGFLALDQFTVGEFTVLAFECLEHTGNFGLGHMFKIHKKPIGAQIKSEDVLLAIVVEHNMASAKARKELGMGDGTPIPSLDGFDGNSHFKIGYFRAEPTYAELREQVSAYLNAKPQISKPYGLGLWAGLSCGD